VWAIVITEMLCRLYGMSSYIRNIFIHLFYVNLLQDMEIVISIITEEKTAAYSIYIQYIQYIHIKFVKNLYQYV
jgi:hypothetical protein